jgi:hypothetical protein
MFEKDSADSPKGFWSGPDDFPEGGEPALFGHDHPGKHSLGASSAQDLPGPKLKAEISVGRSLLYAPYRSLPPVTPTLGAPSNGKFVDRCKATWRSVAVQGPALSKIENVTRLRQLTT